MAKIDVLIENPVPGGAVKTNLNRARRFVRSGRAIFVTATLIRFVDKSAQQAMAQRFVRQSKRLVASRGGYDDVDRFIDPRENRIPVVNAEKMICEEKSSRKWSFTNSVRRRDRINGTVRQVACAN